MNRVLYQLSYAAMGGQLLGAAEISFVIISEYFAFVKRNIRIFRDFFGKNFGEVNWAMILKKTVLFAAGGACYVGLELLWRGRSHSSMFLAGGCCFLLLGLLDKARRLPLPLRAAAGAGIITAVELAAGLLVNRDYAVWDYRNMPLNFLGQICAAYSFLWIPVSLGGMSLYRVLDKIVGSPISQRIPDGKI